MWETGGRNKERNRAGHDYKFFHRSATPSGVPRRAPAPWPGSSPPPSLAFPLPDATPLSLAHPPPLALPLSPSPSPSSFMRAAASGHRLHPLFSFLTLFSTSLLPRAPLPLLALIETPNASPLRQLLLDRLFLPQRNTLVPRQLIGYRSELTACLTGSLDNFYHLSRGCVYRGV